MAAERCEVDGSATDGPHREPLRARPRLLFALIAGVIVAALASLVPAVRREAVLLLMYGWSGACAAWLLSVRALVNDADHRLTRSLAERADDGRAVSRALLTAAALVSLLAVGYSLFRANDLSQSKSPMEYVVIASGVMTVGFTWFLIHTENMLHYAHLYYRGDDGGIDFHTKYADGDGPSYRDFAYLSFTVGMTFQVSDTEINDPDIRRAILHHALLSYMFGTILVALTINGLASLAS